jgi:hypothetical protein
MISWAFLSRFFLFSSIFTPRQFRVLNSLFYNFEDLIVEIWIVFGFRKIYLNGNLRLGDLVKLNLKVVFIMEGYSYLLNIHSNLLHLCY